MENNNDNILSVSALNKLTRSLLENEFSTVLVEGEISNFVSPSSGHWYFTLKDNNAQIRCAMFRFKNQYAKITPSEGLQLIAKGKVSLYEGRGDYQLIVDTLQLQGDGALKQKFEALKTKLAEAGLFDDKKKQPLPDFIQTIGIITSPTGAAIHDILSTLRQRFKGMHVIIYPTLVQGKDAAQAIATAITTANQRQECDALILARGGGSLEDLWPFNEERVAHAIFKSHLPIISGVGHETDITIADLVADCRAPTPTGAAIMACPAKDELHDTILYYQERISTLMQYTLKHAQQYCQHLKEKLYTQHPKRQLQEKTQHIDFLESRLGQAIQKTLALTRTELVSLSKQLDLLSPLKTLDRGYTITYKNNKIITSEKEVHAGEKIVTRLAQGEIISVVV